MAAGAGRLTPPPPLWVHSGMACCWLIICHPVCALKSRVEVMALQTLTCFCPFLSTTPTVSAGKRLSVLVLIVEVHLDYNVFTFSG